MKHSRKNAGFTLVELLVVISIIALLVLIISACAVGGYLVYDHVTEDEPAKVEQVEEDPAEEVDTE